MVERRRASRAPSAASSAPTATTRDGKRLTVTARRFILSAGAIGTPAILIRSGLGGGMVGRRTFLHPVVGAAAHYKDPIEPYYGAPQSVASHALADRGDEVGLFFEAAPLHPMLAAVSTPGFGALHRERMQRLPFLAAHVALAIDGFHPSEEGGTVSVRPSGAPLVDYPVPPRVLGGAARGAQDAGAHQLRRRRARGRHRRVPATSDCRARRTSPLLDRYDVTNAAALLGARDGRLQDGRRSGRSVVRASDLRHHTLENLHVVDGSVFPTSLGVNPQESIYGLAHLVSSRLASRWKS